jgi:hypothetical protein
MNSFLYYDQVTGNGARYLTLEDGTIKAAFTEPGYQEGLRYLAKLYAQGLIDPQAFTNDSAQIQQLGESAEPIMGAVGAGWYGVFTQNGGPSGVKRARIKPRGKGGKGHKFGVAFPFQIGAPQGGGVMGGMGLRMGRAVAIKQAQQMRALAGAVAGMGALGFFDRQIHHLARRRQRGKRAGVQLVDKRIAHGVIGNGHD